jgi:hypothetical protein
MNIFKNYTSHLQADASVLVYTKLFMLCCISDNPRSGTDLKKLSDVSVPSLLFEPMLESVHTLS